MKGICMEIKMMPVTEVKPYPDNPRKNEKAIEAVATSIRTFGFRQPLVVDAAGVVIIGHTRLAAAKFLGLPEVPVHVAANLTPAQCKALRIADNKLAELAEWDKDLLSKELNALDGADLDLTELGFTSRELARLLDPESDDTEATVDFVPDRFEVVVECKDEAQQQELYGRMTGEGFTCRVITI
jgi:site-specific DNA-methyltransferase (adenine-specific)